MIQIWYSAMSLGLPQGLLNRKKEEQLNREVGNTIHTVGDGGGGGGEGGGRGRGGDEILRLQLGAEFETV